ncbi:TRAP transporter substrate-binding protein DctP [Aeromicrobium sp. YIM 150415]|uniref:TRAP transporter substrate-binding protein DctP n=1 Tax=Aeromicrobium sp. YIM 150415 TaxID=2803912 RepID=UPI001963DA2D|nr:TRAP transporter substrate-binding protein DctP [Aeromicrobium sp. YIM 150415]MBM9464091.1 TRAP transporter substrate-binding protein DctP [Aeromicrobium sp. YIM 150415]
MALTLAACGGGGTGGGGTIEEMEPVTLRINEEVPAASGAGEALQSYLDRITAATDGKVTFETFFANSLLTEAYPGLSDGVADMAQVTVSRYESELPISAFTTSFSGSAPPQYPLTLLTMRPASNEFWQTNDTLIGEHEEANSRTVYAGASGHAPLLCSEPITNIDDAKGARVRIEGAYSAAQVRALGMEPVDLPPSEIFEALQRGTITCAMAGEGGENFMSLGLTEVAKHFVPVNLAPTTGFGMRMNLDRWNELPEEARQIFLDEWAEYEIDRNRARLEGFKAFAEQSEELGIEWNDATSLNEVLDSFEDEWLDGAVSGAPAGVDDAQAMADDFNAVIGDWAAKVAPIIDAETDDEQDLDDLREAYLQGADLVDWDAYRELLLGSAQGLGVD